MSETVIQESTVENALAFRLFLLDVVVRNLLREYFAGNPFHGLPGVKSLVWSAGVRAGGVADISGDIRIDTFDTWNPSQAESMPAILVSAGDAASIKLGIANRHMSPGLTDMSGMQTLSRAWAGSVTAFCLSRLPRQSRLIALSSADHLQAFSGQIARRLQLKNFEVAQVKATRPLREMPTILATPIVIEYGLIDTWNVLPAAAPINRFVPTPYVHP